MVSGNFIKVPAKAETFSAIPPFPIIAMTLSPTFQSATPSPTSEIIPATSPPGEKGKGG